MKTLLIFLIITMSAAYAGPRVTGNGGGGVKQNGVYKTFYSAGIYINPKEVTEVPGAELYMNTISSLSGEGSSTARLYSNGIPMGDRKFFDIVEEKMDDTTMARLIAEYARVVNQPSDSLTLFAITDIGTKTTYLLPTFYKLSENEQAAILFHEAYWLLNPKADYAEVVKAEMEFQEFLELKESGKYSHRLPRLLGKLLNDPTFALRSALQEDKRSQSAPQIIDVNGLITLNALFLNSSDLCKPYANDHQVYEKVLFKGTTVKKVYDVTYYCQLSSENLQQVIAFQQKNSKSFFLQEMVSFLSMDNNIFFQTATFGYKDNNPSKENTAEMLKIVLSKKTDLIKADARFDTNSRTNKTTVRINISK
jgi:hypothetical protein